MLGIISPEGKFKSMGGAVPHTQTYIHIHILYIYMYVHMYVHIYVQMCTRACRHICYPCIIATFTHSIHVCTTTTRKHYSYVVCIYTYMLFIYMAIYTNGIYLYRVLHTGDHAFMNFHYFKARDRYHSTRVLFDHVDGYQAAVSLHLQSNHEEQRGM